MTTSPKSRLSEDPARDERRGRPFLLALLYLAPALLFCGGLFLPGRSLYRWDTLLYNWPILLETRSQWLSGHFPFWASSFCCGTPLLANINAGVLYPMRLLCWLLPLRFGYHFFLFAHVWLSLVFTHLLIKRGLRLQHAAAFAGAAAFALGGYARGMWDTHNFMALPWIPLGLLFVLEARKKEKRIPAVLGIAFAWSMLTLGGDFQNALLWIPAAGLLALLQRKRARVLACLAGGVTLAALLTAPQWLPAFFTSALSYRADGLAYADAVERSLHPLRLIEWLVPHAFGTHEQWFGEALAGTNAEKTLPWTASIHVGRIVFLCALLAWGKRRHPTVKWALALTVVTVLLAFGRFLPGFAWWLKLPVLGGFRYPEKYILWTSLGVAILGAFGVNRLLGMARAHQLQMIRSKAWFGGLLVVAGASVACGSLYFLAPDEPERLRWMLWIGGSTLAALLLLLLAVRSTRHPWTRCALPIIIAVDLLIPWLFEQPLTSRFKPLAPPDIAKYLKYSNHARGRLLTDPAATAVRFPGGYREMALRERQALYQQALLTYNSPRLWGLRAAGGFSPLESSAMHNWRLRAATPADRSVPPADSLLAFCRSTGVRWLLTTPERMDEFLAAGLEAELVQRWDSRKEDAARTVLLRLTHTREAVCREPSGKATTRAYNIWRRRPGRIRIDIQPGPAAQLEVRETYAPGWRATDEYGHPLSVERVSDALLEIDLPAGTRQVRLAYTPAGWKAGCLLALGGLLAAGTILVRMLSVVRLKTLINKPLAISLVAVFLFTGLGLGARSHWACTFDEGFHAVRGIARNMQDARLSYFHPPLQNAIGGYFAQLGFAEQMYFPFSSAWERGDVQAYAYDFATTNAHIFPDLIQATRWSATLFGIFLCLASVLFAHRCAGPLAAWLAGIGLALNPSILAHGHLNTTDMGVTALALAGLFAAWNAFKTGRGRMLLLATVFMALSAAVKFTGLAWLGLFMLIVVPFLALHLRKPAAILCIPAGLLLLIALLLMLYGLEPQTIRIATEHPLAGKTVPCGRYIEGLIAQGHHAAEGQQAFLAGRYYDSARWWHLPLLLALKTPLPWLLAALAALIAALRHPNRTWLIWAPAIVFALVFMLSSALLLGIRHALAFEVLLVLSAAAGCARIPWPQTRRIAAALLVLSACASAFSTYPNYIAYTPSWAGGVDNGHEWMSDSNYDWGQELELLEQNWAALTAANQGKPPHLVYFGFVHPRIVYEMPASAPSLCGFMHWTTRRQGQPAEIDQWRSLLNTLDETTIVSASALRLRPYDLTLDSLHHATPVGRISYTFFAIVPEADQGSAHKRR